MNIEELDYHLPEHLIAQSAAAVRDQSRLLVLKRPGGGIEDRHFADIIDYLDPGDCLVINNSRVIPARFFIRRDTGGRIEGLFLYAKDDNEWEVLLKSAHRLKVNETVHLADPHHQYDPLPERPLAVIEKLPDGHWRLRPLFAESAVDVLTACGLTPLPPYIQRTYDHAIDEKESFDRDRYQTVYAASPGSVAAPTAGLHFTRELLEQLLKKQISCAYVTLHVGPGTFKPIATDQVEDHPIHAEFYQLEESQSAIINQTVQNQGRIAAVGTTSVRTLESLAHGRTIQAGAGWTRLFISPGYQFQLVDALITNFHLPRTSLLALVFAFAGRHITLDAYRHAVLNEYRFYSYGDAMLIV